MTRKWASANKDLLVIVIAAALDAPSIKVMKLVGTK
jgi:hypothetical protein